MKARKIRFSNKDKAEFMIELRDLVDRYFKDNHVSKYGNTNMIMKTIFMFSLYFVPYILMMTGVITSPALLLLMWLLMGFGTAGIGLSVMHDANHRSYSTNQKVNGILSWSLNLLGGFAPSWRYQHNTMHHGFTNIEGFDEDIDPGSFLRFSPGKPLYRIHRFQQYYAWFFYGLMTLTWTIDKDFKQIFRYRREGIKLNGGKSFARLFTELILSKIFYYLYILVLPILVLPVPAWEVVLFYLCMHLVSGFVLGIIFQTAHVMPSSRYPEPDSAGTIENSWAIHQLNTTTDYAPGSRLFSWLIGGLNYQVEHHLFPNICHVHYRKISTIIKATTGKYNLPYHVQPDFFSALKEHFKMLKALGKPVVPSVVNDFGKQPGKAD